MKDKIIFQGKTKSGKIISFRYPTINDTQILLDFINKISKEKTFVTFQGEQQTFEEEKKYVESMVDKIKNKKAVYLLGFIDGKFVGSADINMMDKTRSHLGLFGITVAKEYRGEGIGKILMDLVIKESKSKLKELKLVTLDVYGKNFIAQSLYKKLGFKEYARLPQGAKYRGKFDDLISMYKKL
ncbi:MAG: GNAT family N-acetyltransferase [Candidatus Shapirobacteria bacterium]